MRFQLSVPRNTPESSPFTDSIAFMRPYISRVAVHIPHGHLYLTGLQIRAGHRLAVIVPEPGSNTLWLVGDQSNYLSTTRIVLDAPGFNIEMRGYNTDDTYLHVFYIDID